MELILLVLYDFLKQFVCKLLAAFVQLAQLVSSANP